MKVYHGSNLVVRNPMIVKTDYTKDFSWGFYTTTIISQAERWAHRRAQRDGGIPHINTYEFTPAPELEILEFESTTEAWLDFIALCRNGGTHKYDIVIGPMADDEIWNKVEDYLAGEISKEEFLIAAKFKHPTHQISFHTIAALDSLKFIKGDEVE